MMCSVSSQDKPQKKIPMRVVSSSLDDIQHSAREIRVDYHRNWKPMSNADHNSFARYSSCHLYSSSLYKTQASTTVSCIFILHRNISGIAGSTFWFCVVSATEKCMHDYPNHKITDVIIQSREHGYHKYACLICSSNDRNLKFRLCLAESLWCYARGGSCQMRCFPKNGNGIWDHVLYDGLRRENLCK